MITHNGHIDEYTRYLERALSPARFQHSLGVMHTLTQLADIYGLDRSRAVVTGLLHDIAKELPAAQQLALAEEAGIELRYPCERLPIYLHGPIGAHLVTRKFGITDPVILEAIATHTFYGNGPTFGSRFHRCLWLADLAEPTRDFPGVEKLRAMTYAGRMEEALLLHNAWVMAWFHKSHTPIHPNMQALHDALTAKLTVDEAFLERT